jgi:hypothetical protein
MVGAAETGGGCVDLAHASHPSYASYLYGMIGVRGMRRVEKGLWGVLRGMQVLSRVWAVGLGFGFFSGFLCFLAICFVLNFGVVQLLFRASWVSNPLWSPQWEVQPPTQGLSQRKGGILMISTDDVGTGRPKHVTTAD